MTEVPKNITGSMVALGDVVQLSKERSQNPEADGFERYIGLEHLEPNYLKVRNWGDTSDGVTFTNVFRPGQVLFGKRRAYQRKVAVADFSGVCSGDIYVLDVKGNHLMPELLPFICQSQPFYDYVISRSQGGLSPRVNWDALAKYEFAMPPLEEQRRIVKALTATAKMTESLFNLYALGNIVRQSLLEFILDHRPHSTTTYFGDVARLTKGISYKSSEIGDSGPYQILNLNNVAPNGGYRTEGIKFFSGQPKQEHMATVGDLFITATDLTLKKDLIGAPLLVPSDVSQPLVFSLDLIKLTIDTNVVTPKFLFTLLSSKNIRQQMKAHGGGTNVMHLDTTSCLRIPLVVPPIKEQNYLMALLNPIISQLMLINQRIEAVELIQKAIVSPYFNSVSKVGSAL